MQLPLLFSFRQVVLGEGFLAGVRMRGRALLEVEDGECWVTGVAPVGFASACLDFQKGWVGVLFDLADSATSFDDFRSRALEFLGSETDALTAEWQSAVDRVRRAGTTDESLPAEPADTPVWFEVVEIRPGFGPDANEGTFELHAAA